MTTSQHVLEESRNRRRPNRRCRSLGDLDCDLFGLSQFRLDDSAALGSSRA